MPTSLFPDAVLTVEVLERLKLPPEVERYELVDGRIEVLTPTNAEHARIVGRLSYLLTSLAPAGWLVLAGDPGLYVRRRPDTVRGPDLIVISAERYRARERGRAFLTVVPELVIEVNSPSNEEEDTTQKAREYLALGSTVWVVDVDEPSIVVWTPEAERGVIVTDGPVALPWSGALNLPAIFAGGIQ
jgi:Uma2 family endonuclease